MALALGASGAVVAEESASDSPSDGSGPKLRLPEHPLNLNFHLYAFSYHTDREGVRQHGLDNELNTGLGLNYTFHEDERGIGFTEAGFYRDSGSRVAKLAGVGYQYKFGERLRLGGALLGVLSDTYNKGRFFIAPVPMLAYDLGPVQLNVTYVPRYRNYNKFAVFGFFFSFPLGK